MIPLMGAPGTGKFIELTVTLKFPGWREKKRGSYYLMGTVSVWDDGKFWKWVVHLKRVTLLC